ncbi:hypothetical protein ACSBR1_012990 [Camellia fascicularis]
MNDNNISKNHHSKPSRADSLGSWRRATVWKQMWGIYRGATIVLEKGLVEIVIETDTTMAQELLMNGPPQNCPYR